MDMAVSGRRLHDNARTDADQSFEREAQLTSDNERAAELNRQVISVLAGVTGRDPTPDPAAWWQWWADQTDYQQIGDKHVVSVVTEEVKGDPTITFRRGSCFSAGTPVWTEFGQQAIETIQVGDRVLAQDIETGRLAYKPVVRTTVRPARQLLRLRFGDDMLVATAGHRFWVCGEGWVQARNLKPQSLAHTVTGNTPIGPAQPGPVAETYNLIVADYHDYFVGRAGILVQDLPLPQPTNVSLPGLAR
jgi:hypothetical protein